MELQKFLDRLSVKYQMIYILGSNLTNCGSKDKKYLEEKLFEAIHDINFSNLSIELKSRLYLMIPYYHLAQNKLYNYLNNSGCRQPIK
jgi:hypothetical protein